MPVPSVVLMPGEVHGTRTSSAYLSWNAFTASWVEAPWTASSLLAKSITDIPRDIAWIIWWVGQEVQRSNADPVLIALTGYGQEEDRQRAHQAGFHQHLTKPVGLDDIEIVLEKLVPNKG